MSRSEKIPRLSHQMNSKELRKGKRVDALNWHKRRIDGCSTHDDVFDALVDVTSLVSIHPFTQYINRDRHEPRLHGIHKMLE